MVCLGVEEYEKESLGRELPSVNVRRDHLARQYADGRRMFFAFSCLFTLSPQNMADAKAQNIPVLSYPRQPFSPLCRGRQNLLLQRCWSMARSGSSRAGCYFKSFFGHLGRWKGRERPGAEIRL